MRLAKLHNEELHDLYSSPNIIRIIKSRRTIWTGHVECMEEGKGGINIGFSLGKSEGKRQLGRPRRRWENNIKMELSPLENPQVSQNFPANMEPQGSLECPHKLATGPYPETD
jgi:hypothetical protein